MLVSQYITSFPRTVRSTRNCSLFLLLRIYQLGTFLILKHAREVWRRSLINVSKKGDATKIVYLVGTTYYLLVVNTIFTVFTVFIP